jgi:hypothetical protein
VIPRRDELGNACRAICEQSGEQDGRFHLSAGYVHPVVDGPQWKRAVDLQWGRLTRSSFDSGAHQGQGLNDALHRALSERFVTGDRGWKWLTGQDAGQQPDGSARIAGIKYVHRGTKAVESTSFHSKSGVNLLYIDTELSEAVKRAAGVSGIEKPVYFRSSVRQRTDHESAMGYGFVTGDNDCSLEPS